MKRALFPIGTVLGLFLLAGCGGGGSGSGSPYTGVTTQAQLADNNVVDIAREAFLAGDMSSSMVVPLGDSGAGTGADAGSPRAVALARTLLDAAGRAASATGSPSRTLSFGAARPMEVVTYEYEILDGLGGSILLSFSMDTATGDFTGTFTFNGWHGEGGALISGTTSVTGNYDQASGAFTRIRFTFHSVAMVDGGESVTVTGTVDLTVGTFSGSATVEMYLRDNLTGKTVWISGYTVSITEGAGYEDVDVSGRIYLHDYGYVDVSTPLEIRFYDGYTNPSSGVLLVEGSGGRSARLVVVDGVPESSGYYVEADLDANGIYEWVSIVRPWE